MCKLKYILVVGFDKKYFFFLNFDIDVIWKGIGFWCNRYIINSNIFSVFIINYFFKINIIVVSS